MLDSKSANPFDKKRFSLISKEEMEKENIISDDRKSPGDYENAMLDEMNKRQAKTESILRLKYDDSVPEKIEFPEKIDIFEIFTFSEAKNLLPEEKYNEAVNAYRQFEDYLINDGVDAGLFRYLLEKSAVNQGKIKINYYLDEDGCDFGFEERSVIKNLAKIAKTIKTKKDFYLAGKVCEQSTDAKLSDVVYLEEGVKNIGLYDRVDKILVENLGREAVGYYSVLEFYKIARMYGEDIIPQLINANVKVKELEKKFVPKDDFLFNLLERHNSLIYDPRTCELINSFNSEDLLFASGVLKKISSCFKKHRDAGGLDYSRFFHFVELIKQHKSEVENFESDKTDLNEEYVHYLEEFLFLIVYSPDKLKSAINSNEIYKLRNDNSIEYIFESGEFFEDINQYFGISADLDNRISHGNVLESNKLYSTLKFLSENPLLKEYIKENFSIQNLSDLYQVTLLILAEREDINFAGRIGAVKDFERITKSSDNEKISNLMFLGNKKIYDVDTIKFFQDIYLKTGYNFADEVEKYHYEHSKYDSIIQWRDNPEIFIKAHKFGLLGGEYDDNSDEYSSNLYRLETIKYLFENQDLFDFLIRNSDLELLQRTLRQCNFSDPFNKKGESVLAWFKNQEAFLIAKKLGLFDKENQSINYEDVLFRYDYFAELGKIDEKDVDSLIKNYEFITKNLSISNDIIIQSFPVKFLAESVSDPRVMDIAQEAKPLYQINFDDKYQLKSFYDKRLEWITSIDQSIRGKFLEYLEEANIRDFNEITKYATISLADVKREYGLGDGEMKEVEQAFFQETAPWRERKKVIDFLEIANFKLQNEEQFEILKKLANKFDMDDCANLYNRLCKKEGNEEHFEEEIKIFEKFVNNFGLSFMPTAYGITKQLLNGVIPAELNTVISFTGDKGIAELKSHVKEVVNELIKDEDSIDPNNCTSLVIDTFRFLLRFDTSTWKRGLDFVLILQSLDKNRREGLIEPLSSGYEIKKIKLKSIPKNLDLSKFKEGYTAAIKIIENGISEITFEGTKRKLADIFNNDLADKKKAIESVMEKGDVNEKKIASLKNQIAKSEIILKDLNKAEDSERIFSILANSNYSLPGIADVVQNMVISDFLIKNEDWKPELEAIIRNNEIKISNINRMIEFLSIQIKEHALASEKDTENYEDSLYPKISDKERKYLKKFFSPRGLSEVEREAAKTKSDELNDDFSLKPSRCIMGEMSGYLADACWTRKNSILRNNPNMTPVLLIKSPEENPEILGASLLFENSINGGQDKVIILRGVNPQDKLLEKVSVNSYCEEMIAYAEKVARTKGCKYLVANTAGSIISNRPGVANYFQNTFPEKKSADPSGDLIGTKIKLDQNMNFNEYEITDSCIIIKEIKS